MAWVSPKVYAILSSDEKGKDIIEDLPNMSQEECDRKLDDFFGDREDYKSAKNELKANDDDYDDNEKEMKSLEAKNTVTRAFTELGTLSGSKENRKMFEDALNSREVLDADLEYMLAYCVRWGFSGYSFNTLYLRKNQSSWFQQGDYVQIGGLSEVSQKFVIDSLAHEVGHAMDYDKSKRKFRSSEYISDKYGLTLQDMIKKKMEEANIGELKDFFNNVRKIKQELNERYKRKELTYEEYVEQWYDAGVECDGVADILEANIGVDTIPGVYGHGSKYWGKEEDNVGTELFAEITASRVADKKQTTVQFLKKFAPECLEIYDEIINNLKKEMRKVSW